MVTENYVSPFRNPFTSFWMAGFECTDKLNCHKDRVDFLTITRHLEKLDEDYKNLVSMNFGTVREGIRWSVVEKSPYTYNWTDVEKIIKAARKYDLQVIWDICHFGFPDDITPLDADFANRFSQLCRAFVKFYRSVEPRETLIVTPFNEVSFLAWLGGEVGGTSPFRIHYGVELKYEIMKAYIQGVKAIKEEDPNTRIMLTEPLVNMVPPSNATPEEIKIAEYDNESQYQVFEILSGKMYPELGGKPEYLDIIGSNYYYNNQWITRTTEFLPWVNTSDDPRWVSPATLIEKLYDRYQRPIVLSETSHPKEDRPNWMKFIAEETAKVVRQGIPFWGICWYPIIDRPDWDHLHDWHRSGVWDINVREGYERILHEPTAQSIRESQALIKDALEGRRVSTKLHDTR